MVAPLMVTSTSVSFAITPPATTDQHSGSSGNGTSLRCSFFAISTSALAADSKLFAFKVVLVKFEQK